MIVISHDKVFLDTVITETWEFEKEGDSEFRIKY